MTRHHGLFASPCRFCGLFKNMQCEKFKVKLKAFVVLDEEYAEIEVARFNDKANGNQVNVFPGYNYISHNTGCGIFESWLNRKINELIEIPGDNTKHKAMRCDCFQRFQYI